MANRVGKMLKAMKLIDENPFEICSWTNDEEKDMKANEEDRSRMLWDDRIQKLFASPVYQGQCDEDDYPLFWAPLIARFGGGRAEEILQLGPDDFGSENGIAYFTVRNVIGNHVKSTAGERRIPVHPTLIQLGLLRFVEMRRRQNHSRLFPNLNRGKTKDTFSELFSKTFGYYRKTNDCYWSGLDFHAFRTTFHNDLGNLLCPDMIRRRLMGHRRSRWTRVTDPTRARSGSRRSTMSSAGSTWTSRGSRAHSPPPGHGSQVLVGPSSGRSRQCRRISPSPGLNYEPDSAIAAPYELTKA